jgi:hypothetical protein
MTTGHHSRTTAAMSATAATTHANGINLRRSPKGLYSYRPYAAFCVFLYSIRVITGAPLRTPSEAFPAASGHVFSL